MFVKTSDGIVLSCYHFKVKKEKRHMIVYFPGNYSDIFTDEKFVRNLIKKVQCDILYVHYRGYETNEGTPYEEGLIRDAVGAMNWVGKKYPNKAVYAFGCSIGGSVVFHLVKRLSTVKKDDSPYINGIVIQNTFTSMVDMIEERCPLCHCMISSISYERWNNVKAIEDTESHIPCLFLSSKNDSLVPSRMMRQLSNDVYQSGCYNFVSFNKDHNNIHHGTGYYDSIADFINNGIPRKK
ncbi:MAG: alpha/beta hydrolase [Promethearchaeota archaeon]